MTISAGITQIPSASGYVIESHEELSGEHRFHVRFDTNQGPVIAHATWRQIDGAWKVVTLGVEGVQS
jgi:hypothetical protein